MMYVSDLCPWCGQLTDGMLPSGQSSTMDDETVLFLALDEIREIHWANFHDED
jgi:hypothetical protein